MPAGAGSPTRPSTSNTYCPPPVACTRTQHNSTHSLLHTGLLWFLTSRHWTLRLLVGCPSPAGSSRQEHTPNNARSRTAEKQQYSSAHCQWNMGGLICTLHYIAHTQQHVTSSTHPAERRTAVHSCSHLARPQWVVRVRGAAAVCATRHQCRPAPRSHKLQVGRCRCDVEGFFINPE